MRQGHQSRAADAAVPCCRRPAPSDVPHAPAMHASAQRTTTLRTLSGRSAGSSQVMKKGFGARPGSSNLLIVATRHVSLLPSGRSRTMWPSMWSSLAARSATSAFLAQLGVWQVTAVSYTCSAWLLGWHAATWQAPSKQARCALAQCAADTTACFRHSNCCIDIDDGASVAWPPLAQTDQSHRLDTSAASSFVCTQNVISVQGLSVMGVVAMNLHCIVTVFSRCCFQGLHAHALAV